MDKTYYVYFTVSILITVCVYLICISLTYKKRHLHSATTLCFYFSCMFIWCAASLFEVIVSTEALKLIFLKVSCLGSLFICPIWIIFVIQNRKKIGIHNSLDTILLWIGIPCFMTIYAIINPGGTFFKDLAVSNSGQLISVKPSILFFAYLVYLAFGLCYLLGLIYKLCSEGRLLKRQGVFFVVSPLLPMATATLYFAGLLQADCAALAFIVTCVCVLLQFKNYLFVDLPPSLMGVFKYAAQGIIVLNHYDQIVYMNKMGAAILGITRGGQSCLSEIQTGLSVIEAEKDGVTKEISCYKMEMNGDFDVKATVLFLSDAPEIYDLSKQRSEFVSLDNVLDLLPSVEKFTARLESLIEKVQCTPHEALDMKYALAYIDIDNFDNVNRTIGRNNADILLKILAKRLTDVTGSTADVCRIRGDEFLVIFKSRDDANLKAEQVYRRIKFATEVPFIIMENEVNLATSVGIGLMDEATPPLEVFLNILHNAARDLALKGGNGYIFATEEFRKKKAFEGILRRDLGRAADRGELHLLYQPQFNTNGVVVGFEVLVRWNHPTLGPVMPGDFICLAEESGEILKIGKWVLEEALKEWAQQCWENVKLREVKLSINVCVVQLRELNFAKTVIAAIEKYGIQPHQIYLEITESVALYDDARVFENLKILDQRGISIAIDDFGMGYTSLRYIKTLPISTIKLDGMFSDDVVNSAPTAMIVEAMAILCRQMGMDMIVEQVETKEQLEILKSLGCTVFQGYYFSKPIPATKIKEYINQ